MFHCDFHCSQFNLFGDFSQLISSYHFIQVPYLACYNAFIVFTDGCTDAISINLSTLPSLPSTFPLPNNSFTVLPSKKVVDGKNVTGTSNRDEKF